MQRVTNETLQRIDRLRRKVASYPGSLGPCLPEQEIAAFEAIYRIQLPEDFRLFLLNIGNGGSGPPTYGLNSLAQSVRREPDGPGETSNTSSLCPELPFPLTEAWVWEDEDLEDEDTRLNAVYNHGHLFLGTDGCAMDWILIVAGAERGKIWNRADVGAQPCAPSRDFASWYEYWLDGGQDWYGS